MMNPVEQEREDVVESREVWREIQPKLDIEKLVALDESSVNLSYTRLYGWAPSGERVNEGVVDVRFERGSILSTMRVNGSIVPVVFEGTLNKEIFCAYIEQQLAPSLSADDIVLLDNCTVHSAKLVKETLRRCGVTFWYLPKYSPDLNPIELMWAYVKAILRKLKARTVEHLQAALKTAFDRVTPDLIKSWFAHCGYS
jgi:transposase